MQLMLAQAGFEAVPTYSGEEALEKISTTGFSAVLLDFGWPHKSGIEVLGEIKGNPETASLPVIIVSGRSPLELEDVPTPLVLDWVTKPIDEGRLLKRLRSAIHQTSAPTVLLADDDEEDIRTAAQPRWASPSGGERPPPRRSVEANPPPQASSVHPDGKTLLAHPLLLITAGWAFFPPG